jgi:hypothetical protein
MKENMSNGLGIVDKGPARPTHLRPGYAGPVLCYREGDAHGTVLAPYDLSTVRDIVKQGRDRPRPLTAEVARLAARNRADARAQAALFESWARALHDANPYRVGSNDSQEFVPEQ